MHRCCRSERTSPAPPDQNSPPPNLARRAAAFVTWALPITALALVPKCPACVAAYILLFTGIGLSIPTATTIRWAFIALCVATLIILLAKKTFSMLKQARA